MIVKCRTSVTAPPGNELSVMDLYGWLADIPNMARVTPVLESRDNGTRYMSGMIASWEEER